MNFPGAVFTPRGQSVPPGPMWLSRNAKRAVHAAAGRRGGLVTKRGAAHIKVVREHKEKANEVDNPHTCGNLHWAQNQRLPARRVLIRSNEMI